MGYSLVFKWQLSQVTMGRRRTSWESPPTLHHPASPTRNQGCPSDLGYPKDNLGILWQSWTTLHLRIMRYNKHGFVWPIWLVWQHAHTLYYQASDFLMKVSKHIFSQWGHRVHMKICSGHKPVLQGTLTSRLSTWWSAFLLFLLPIVLWSWLNWFRRGVKKSRGSSTMQTQTACLASSETAIKEHRERCIMQPQPHTYK